MNKRVKLIHNTDSKVFFWGCLHVFHDPKWDVPIWKSRGYDSVSAHANGIREKINNTCSKNDTLIILGDGFLNSSPDQVEAYLLSLNPNILYQNGNHESSMSRIYRREVDKYLNSYGINDKELEIYPFEYKNITFLSEYVEYDLKINNANLSVAAFHYPIKVFNGAHRMGCHIHSHNHAGLKSSLPDAQEGKILETSVDVFPNGPLSADKLLEIMNKKEHKRFDNHH